MFWRRCLAAANGEVEMKRAAEWCSVRRWDVEFRDVDCRADVDGVVCLVAVVVELWLMPP